MSFLKTTALLLFSTLIANTSNAQRQSNQKKEKKHLFNSSISSSANRQSNYYTFSYSSGTFTPLTGATSVNNGQLWDDPLDYLPIGFNFTLYNQTIDTLDFFYGYGGSLSDISWTYVLAPFDLDLIDRGDLTGTSVSPISYKVEGAPGSRIFKLEWLNAGSFDEGDSLGTLNDFVNMQMWLYEGSNNVEYHFGSTNFANTYSIYGIPGGVIGIYDDAFSDLYLLNGASSAPTMTGTTNNPFITSDPPSGIIYKFTYNANTGINNLDKNYSTALYPNPVKDFLTINVSGNKLNNAELIITDVMGREVKKQDDINSNEMKISAEELSNGVYFYQLKQDSALLSTGKFVKK